LFQTKLTAAAWRRFWSVYMPVIAIVNRKGGSGKSTLATHIAAWCAREGLAVMLGDVDRQQSTRSWLRLRNPSLPAIAPWAVDNKNTLRVPSGISHVVLDTPGGLHGFELARVVMFADAILVPVCDSIFDRDSAAMCKAAAAAWHLWACGWTGARAQRSPSRPGAKTLACRFWAHCATRKTMCAASSAV
jgi:hypothetical protein